MAEIFRSVGKNHKVNFKNFHFFPHSKTLLILPLSKLDIKLHDKSLKFFYFFFWLGFFFFQTTVQELKLSMTDDNLPDEVFVEIFDTCDV